jgi:hypothetical protein
VTSKMLERFADGFTLDHWEPLSVLCVCPLLWNIAGSRAPLSAMFSQLPFVPRLRSPRVFGVLLWSPAGAVGLLGLLICISWNSIWQTMPG